MKGESRAGPKATRALAKALFDALRRSSGCVLLVAIYGVARLALALFLPDSGVFMPATPRLLPVVCVGLVLLLRLVVLFVVPAVLVYRLLDSALGRRGG